MDQIAYDDKKNYGDIRYQHVVDIPSALYLFFSDEVFYFIFNLR